MSRSESIKPYIRILWIIFGLVVLTFLALYGIENLRGRIALEEAYAEVMSVKPAHIDARRDEPYPAEEENFFGTPLLAGLTRVTVDPDESKDPWARVRFSEPMSVERVESVSLPQGGMGRYGYFPRSILLEGTEAEKNGLDHDLEIWAAVFRTSGEFDVGDPSAPAARQILSAMDNRFGAELKELADAATRRVSTLPRDSIAGNGALPDLGSMISLQISGLKRLLALRMAAAIAAEDRKVVHETFLILVRLFEGLHPGQSGDDLLFLSNEVSVLLDQISYGFRREFWEKEDLELLHRQLTGFRLHERIEGAFFGSARFQRSYFETIRRRPGVLADGYRSFAEVPIQVRVAQIGPRGWIDLNAAESIRRMHSVGIVPWQSRDFRSLPTVVGRLPDFRQPGTFLLETQLFPDAQFSMRLAAMAVDWELTRLACVLEIHRIDTGGYPDTLAAVVDPVPLDPFTQKELIYRNDGDRFLLYSAGWNLRDDLGAVMRGKRNRLDLSVGDWVWGEEDLLDAWQNEKRTEALAWIAMERELGRPVTEGEFNAAQSAASVAKESGLQKRAREGLMQKARERIARDREAMGKK